jgi:hypothetical protein
MPLSFALDAVESAVDYDYVLIGESKYLLPVHSEALSCLRGTSDCTRNVIEFRDYTPLKTIRALTAPPQLLATDTIHGKIKRIAPTQLVLNMDEGRDVAIALDRNTRYFDNSGNNARYGDFDIGDQVSVDAELDSQNYYHGTAILLIKRGAPVKDSDPDRPILRRGVP